MRNFDGERALVSAILNQAFSDAFSHDPNAERLGARRFIDGKNKLFSFYCNLLDIDPEQMASAMQKRIRNNEFKPLKQFRE